MAEYPKDTWHLCGNAHVQILHSSPSSHSYPAFHLPPSEKLPSPPEAFPTPDRRSRRRSVPVLLLVPVLPAAKRFLNRERPPDTPVRQRLLSPVPAPAQQS